MDWEHQPAPFRWYDGAPCVPLPQVAAERSPRFEPACREGRVEPRPVCAETIGQLLQDALGLSAWKQAGDSRWALRMNPSSGNLHPTEGYLICGAIDGLTERPGVFHYQPHQHALEHRAVLPALLWRSLVGRLPADTMLVGLTSIYLRESWKYGERAFRYCQLDVGHAVGALAFAAAGLGWRARRLGGLTDAALTEILGIGVQEGIEAEHPDLLLAIGPAVGGAPRLPSVPPVFSQLHWQGAPRALGSGHHPWPIIDAVHAATVQRTPPTLTETPAVCAPPEIGDSALKLRPIIHARRSAASMDGRTGVSRAALHQILHRCLPGPDRVSHSVLPGPVRIQLFIWVHRVADIEPGLYCLVCDLARLDDLRSACDPAFDWTPALDGLPLYRLRTGDVRREAAAVSCGQDIASDGVLAVALVADFERALEAEGPHAYRSLHWEAGNLGQVLYLEAEATGIRGTGIGCFFDDETHRMLGMRGTDWQVLYHFTMGGPVEDSRLQTLTPYHHIEAQDPPSSA